MTALTPIDRFVQDGAPEALKPILIKRSAAYTLIIGLVLFILFKPSPIKPIVVQRESKPTETITKSVISPDRILVTDIQGQVADVSKMFGEGLIQSVQANFRLGKLIVLVTDAWYQLTPYKQDQLMESLLERSVNLGFKKLFLADTHQALIARNPDVGIKMIVLKRQPQ